MAARYGGGLLFHRLKVLLWVILSLGLFSACLPEPTPVATPTPSPTVTQTATATATVVWFPPTATFTPMPTRQVTPTVDLRPALGEVILNDPFTDKTQWQVMRTAVGSIAYGKSELTLAVSQPRGSLLSLRKAPQLTNFYLEMDVLPSLCRDGDTFGLLVRAASGADYYRLLLNCSGQLRMERLKNSKAVPLQDWVVSGQIIPGGMMRNRLGLWAKGEEMRVYVNGDYQFTVKDPVYSSGVVGVFARSQGETQLTVNFSNLKIYNVGASTPGKVEVAPTASKTP